MTDFTAVDPKTLVELAITASSNGNHEAAIGYCRSVCESATDDSHLLTTSARILYEQGCNQEALAALHRAALSQPDDAEIQFYLGNVYADLDELEKASQAYQCALNKRPSYPECLNNLGIIYTRLGSDFEAEAVFARALALQDMMPEPLTNLADLYRRQGKLSDSEAACRRALQIKPDHRPALINLANALREQGRFADALHVYRGPLATYLLDPINANNMGAILSDLGRLDEAITALSGAVEGRPDYVDAEVNLALSLLKAGRYLEGWRRYQARWRHIKNRNDTQRFSKPVWRGQPLKGKTLLLHAEQGLGDTLQFFRYVQVLAMAHNVILEVQPCLVKYLRTHPSVDNVYAAGDTIPPHDYHCALIDLPFVFTTLVETIPNPNAYLPPADPKDVGYWRGRLNDVSGLKVGLVWSGSQAMGANNRRSVPIDALKGLIDISGVTLIATQVGISSEQLVQHDMKWIDFSAESRGFEASAALFTVCDILVTVDTASAHLAAGLGRPTWLLNRYDSCWRWMLGREDTPWYDTMRIFRQNAPGDWSGVILSVRAALESHVHDITGIFDKAAGR